MDGEVSLPWNMQMGRYMTAYEASFLWPSREFLMMCEADRPCLQGPAKVQTARRALTPNPAFAVAQKVRFDAPRFLCTCLRPVVALSGLSETSAHLSAFGVKRTYM